MNSSGGKTPSSGRASAYNAQAMAMIRNELSQFANSGEVNGSSQQQQLQQQQQQQIQQNHQQQQSNHHQQQSIQSIQQQQQVG